MAKERWSDRGEVPEIECEKVSAPKSSLSWTVEDIARLKARVPFVPNWWNWLCDKLDGVWGLGVFFFAIFTIAFGPWVFDAWFGIGKNSALNIAFTLFYGVVLGFILMSTLANRFKARPPAWSQDSLGNFYKSHGEIAAMSEFQNALVALPKNLPLEDLLTLAALEIEYCDQSSVVLVWRLVFSHVTTGPPPARKTTSRLVFQCKTPVLVFDVASKRLVDPELLPRSVPMDPTIIIG